MPVSIPSHENSGEPPLLLMECPIAGFQFGDGDMCWHLMRLHDPLTLRREHDNPHDPRAVRVYWHDLSLGYVPREANYAIAQMLDRGEPVVGRVSGLQACANPWKRVTLEVLWAGGSEVSFAPPPAPPPVQPTDVLVQSLTRRVFGPRPSPEACAWVQRHGAGIALVGVERPAFLPYLRMVFAGEGAGPASDPAASLKAQLADAGMDPRAWRHLGHWRFHTFEELGESAVNVPNVAAVATLLLELEVVGSPPPGFVGLVASLARHRLPPAAPAEFERLPLWFTHALLRHIDDHRDEALTARMRSQVFAAADWLFDTAPSPDANQRRAGWSWILSRVYEHAEAQRRGATPAWDLPFGERTIGRRRIVPIRNFAELEAEPRAMKNCLRDYELECGSGYFAVYSIRDALTDQREACFAVERTEPGEDWTLVDVAGIGNAQADEELWLLAEAFITARFTPSSDP